MDLNQIEMIFQDKNLMAQALTHKSYAFEKGPNEKHNEILEFLGDAVLDLAVSELLIKEFALDQEGALSKKRASLVNEETLAQIALEIGLSEKLRLGRGEEGTGGRNKSRILASALEAIIGARFIESGYEAAREIVRDLFNKRILDAGQFVEQKFDYKSQLQEYYQEMQKTKPDYVLISAEGPDHEKSFNVAVHLQGQAIAFGTGRSKKIAEQEAARIALEKIKGN